MFFVFPPTLAAVCSLVCYVWQIFCYPQFKCFARFITHTRWSICFAWRRRVSAKDHQNLRKMWRSCEFTQCTACVCAWVQWIQLGLSIFVRSTPIECELDTYRFGFVRSEWNWRPLPLLVHKSEWPVHAVDCSSWWLAVYQCYGSINYPLVVCRKSIGRRIDDFNFSPLDELGR